MADSGVPMGAISNFVTRYELAQLASPSRFTGEVAQALNGDRVVGSTMGLPCEG